MDQNRASLTAFLVLFALFLGLVLWICAPFLLALFAGQLLALLAGPSYRRLAKKIRRRLAAGATTFGLAALVIAPLSLFATAAVRQAVEFAETLQVDGKLNAEAARRVLEPLERWLGSSERLERQALQSLQRGAQALGRALLALARSTPMFLLQIALALIACYFLLLDEGHFLESVAQRLPIDPDLRKRVLEVFRKTAVATVWATMAAAGSQAAVILAGFLSLGIPGAFFAAGLTFVFAWIPMLGSIPAVLAAMAYLWHQEELGKLALMFGVGFIAGVIDNLVRPIVLKGQRNLHPLISLVSILGGIQAFGVLGVFIGPVLAAVLVSLYQLWPVVERRAGMEV